MTYPTPFILDKYLCESNLNMFKFDGIKRLLFVVVVVDVDLSFE